MEPLTLLPVPAGTHTADDLVEVLAADEAQPLIERYGLVYIHQALCDGRMVLYRLKPGPGIMVTEIQMDHGVKRLCVFRGASSGHYGASLRKVLKQLWRMAQDEGCECVQTVVYSERLMKALQHRGVAVEGYIMTYAGE